MTCVIAQHLRQKMNKKNPLLKYRVYEGFLNEVINERADLKNNNEFKYDYYYYVEMHFVKIAVNRVHTLSISRAMDIFRPFGNPPANRNFH